jgi:hypothetical protein
MSKPTLMFHAALPPDEYLRRLREQAKPMTLIRGGLFGPPQGTIMAKITGSSICLFACGPRYLYNSFEPYFYGTVEPQALGSLIQGRFRVHPFVRLFMAFWFGVLGVAWLSILVAALLGRLSPGMPPLIALALPAAIALGGFMIVRLCSWLGDGQKKRICEFIEGVTQARKGMPHVG